jgi:hypothetical protein
MFRGYDRRQNAAKLFECISAHKSAIQAEPAQTDSDGGIVDCLSECL